MLILLSSALRPRYKDDILRSLSAPIGARLRFRYRKDLIEPKLLSTMRNDDVIVCFLHTSKTESKELFLVPIRIATLDKIHTHGSTVSVDIKVNEFPNVPDIGAFQRIIFQGKEMVIPNFANDQFTLKSGFLFFEASSALNAIDKDISVESWENIVNKIAQFPQFSSESYFWTVLGIYHEIPKLHNLDFFAVLPERELRAKSHYRLFTYHYHPNFSRAEQPVAPITISYGDCIQVEGPNELEVDSAYDLKEFILRISNHSFTKRNTWIRLGPKQHMLLDFEICIGTDIKRYILSAIAIAVAIFAQSVLSMSEPIVTLKVILAGLLSLTIAFAAVFGIKRDI